MRIYPHYTQSFKVVYTVSDTSDLIPCILRSIKSLERFISKEDVIVFYTPPRSMGNYVKLLDVATVKKADNITKPFDMMAVKKQRMNLPLEPHYYGEKIHLCDVDCENVMFLDADTFVRKDITQLLEGDYDFSALPPILHDDGLDYQSMEKIFIDIGKEPLPQFNCGFLIFKNGFHHKVKDLWLKYTNDYKFPNHLQFGCKEQWALSLALAYNGAKIKNMTFEQNARTWAGKTHADAFVVHGRKPSMYKCLRVWFGRERRRVQRKMAL